MIQTVIQTTIRVRSCPGTNCHPAPSKAVPSNVAPWNLEQSDSNIRHCCRALLDRSIRLATLHYWKAA